MVGVALTEAIRKGNVDEVNDFLARWAAENHGVVPERMRLPSSSGASSCVPPLGCLPPDFGSLKSGSLRGFNLNAPLPKGYTPLQLAARIGQVQIVRLLLNIQVDPNGLDAGFRAPLHYAARYGHVQIVADLLAEQADPCIIGKEGGMTPLDLARKFDHSKCVRVLESNLKLWQGWVDHLTSQLLGVKTWTPTWLVICQHSRPNTGPKCNNARQSCLGCGSTVQVPPYVTTFQCPKCSSPLHVSASVQLATYKLSSLQRNMILPDAAQPSLVVALPYDPSQIKVKIESDNFDLGKALFNAISGVMLNTAHSNRRKEISFKSLDRRGMVTQEHHFRVGTDEERNDLALVLRDPLMAAYTMNVANNAAPPPPTAPPTAAIQSSAAASAAAPSPPLSAPDKTGHYSLDKKPKVVNPILLQPPDAASSAGGNASAPSPDSLDEARQCVICMERLADTAVIPCGHMCGCSFCLEAVRASPNALCPVCRGPATAVIRIFQN